MAQGVKHTPGPWLPAMMSTKIMNVLPHRIHGFVVQMVGGTDGQMIAHVHGRTEKECEANARLIAAAPELLEALKLVAYGGNFTNFDEAEWTVVNSAIAKAEGR